jgi:hypothetical protein
MPKTLGEEIKGNWRELRNNELNTYCKSNNQYVLDG